MKPARELVAEALEALEARQWDRFEALLHPDVVHRTPGAPDPVLGKTAFLHLVRETVRRTPDVTFRVERIVAEGGTVVVEGEWRYTGPQGSIRQPAVSVIQLMDGLIYRDDEYFGLTM